MKFKDCQFRPKNRRGLATIVGGLIFVILMVSAFSMFGLAMEYQGDIGQTAKIVANADLKKQQEDFKINIFTDSNQLLTVDVTNIGQNHVEIPTLIITNSTDAANGFPTKVHDIPSSRSFVAPGYTGNVVLTFPITLKLAQNPGDTELYHFKVISSLGTIKTQSVSCDDTRCGPVGTGGSLEATLFLDGPNGVNTKTSTVVMFVSNTADVAITDVQPTAGFSLPMCDDLWTFDNSGATETKFVEDVDPCAVSPSSPITLDPHATALFKWDGIILGDIGSVFTFCSAVSGTHPDEGSISSGAPTCDSLTVIDPNDCDGCGPGDGDEVVLKDELFGRPRLFMMFPNTIGDNLNDRGIWSLNVANPTDQSIYINKAIIVAFSPNIVGSDIVFEKGCETKGTNEVPVVISPTTGSWTCPENNNLVWQDLGTPQEILPRSVFPFMVKVAPASLGNTVLQPSNMMIQPVVFSTLGQFGKAGYASGYFKEHTAIPNVFLARDLASTADADIIAEMRGISSGSTVTFIATLADMDTDTTWQLNSDSRLIINIHREWTFNSVISHVGFNTPVIQTFGDGSTQITATLVNPMTGNNDAKSIKFTAVAPTVTLAKLHVMYLLADGTMTDGTDTFTIGPLSEVVVQTCPGDPAVCPT